MLKDKSLTQIGDVLGTPAYMAPEQARGEVTRHGLAMDVYALGAMLYHLLRSTPSWDGRLTMRELTCRGKRVQIVGC